MKTPKTKTACPHLKKKKLIKFTNLLKWCISCWKRNADSIWFTFFRWELVLWVVVLVVGNIANSWSTEWWWWWWWTVLQREQTSNCADIQDCRQPNKGKWDMPISITLRAKPSHENGPIWLIIWETLHQFFGKGWPSWNHPKKTYKWLSLTEYADTKVLKQIRQWQGLLWIF